ncbi:MAG: 2Fe-2S iron-sulfur cluster-binding protein [Pyrinomonadaceae bacterium]
MEFDLTDVLKPYERLIEIEIRGKRHQVPENNTILRCLQYLDTELISYADLCWNGECINCQVWVQNGDKEKMVMACSTQATEGMRIVKLAESIELS